VKIKTPRKFRLKANLWQLGLYKKPSSSHSKSYEFFIFRRKFMKTLKKLGLIFSTIAFCMTLAVTASYAQPGKAKYKGNNGKHKGWTQGKNKGWDKRDNKWVRNNGRDYRRYRDGRYYDRNGRRITPQERRRLERQQSRLGRLENRYYRDGSLSKKEQQKLDSKYSKYRRSVRKARRK